MNADKVVEVPLVSTRQRPAKPPLYMKLGNFALGGLAGMTAVSILLPLDMIKVRIQISSECGERIRNPFVIARRLYNNEGGLRAFYRGIDSALLRQAIFTSLRLGIFTNLGEIVKRYRKRKTLTLYEKVICSLTAGGIAAFIDTPLDLSLVRMQADRTLPAELQRKYRNVVHALTSVIKEEGIVKLWKGAPPTVCRAMAANLAMLTTYEEAKERLTARLGKQSYISLLSGVIAGVTSATVSLPFDNIKTKIQKMKARPGEPSPYKGVFDCLVKTCVREGPSRLWVGLATYYVRVAPQATITLVVYDILKNALKKLNS
eukprot:TRINITY_DN3130_c0_g1_i1.p1 TRINITY_DN3130_c0_g1~~TRINITY_DN3130_c0_g1_i1.p1  ORF type:complete len:317 (-),score=83.76 TRINITY_DN3130_c0_g1_i1:232-1182(-)